eukprot:gnl/TRDRNA2_/TRDRNA2_44812_c0_seq1.p1 gnl/TRDRNA2_/TRDRNA2_44812_c0~~gnl/TRDRNA2_/TRDRNA2_44812_c0_seq1.p1  ORF type:complete len:446 (+),score=90.00 gnl/TRDRNA2_/TRDRNA2_44812_c0_seq1:69-1340(+)
MSCVRCGSKGPKKGSKGSPEPTQPPAAGDEEYDEFGFALAASDDQMTDAVRTYERSFEAEKARRLQRFEARRRRLKDAGREWSSLPKAELKKLLRLGVPNQHRGEVWWSILGCEARRKRQPGIYKQYLGEGLSPRSCDSIDRDIPRTFPNHRKFRSEAGMTELRNVLHAFARHSPKVRYCQGLNFIAALLLVHLEEERAFWALVSAMDSLGCEGYYTEGMILLRADIVVLETLLKQKCPKTAKHFKEQNVELTSICSEWYITWFAKCLPTTTMLRVWDTLFYEGWKVLFRVSVGVFKRVEAELLRSCADFEQIMEMAKTWPRSQVEHNELIKTCFGGLDPLRRRDLLQAREGAIAAIQREDEEHRKRSESNRLMREAQQRQAMEEKAAKEKALASEEVPQERLDLKLATPYVSENQPSGLMKS